MIADTWLLARAVAGARAPRPARASAARRRRRGRRGRAAGRGTRRRSTASTTSLTVPPSALRIAFISARSARAAAHRRCGPMAPSIDRAGVGCRLAAERPRRRRAMLAERGRRLARAAHQRAGRRGPARPGCAAARRTRIDGERGVARLRCRRPRRRRGGGCGVAVGVEQLHHQVGAGDAVDHAVVDLGDQRPPAAGEALDHPHLPQRAMPVELHGHQPAHQVVRAPSSPPGGGSAEWRTW